MGNAMSFSPLSSSADEPSDLPIASRRMSSPPSHINLAPPQFLGAISISPSSSPSPRDNPFDSPPLSPIAFYTAPSTPIPSPRFEEPPPPLQQSHPIDPYSTPSSPPPSDHRVIAPSSFELETIPLPDVPSPDFSLEFTLNDEGLSTLEKIYLFSRSKSTYHRVFISHAVPSFLEQVTPTEAVEYVLPLLPGLAMDDDETVKEALASELVNILWWFLTHCRLVEESSDHILAYSTPESSHDQQVTLLSVQAFTPVLGTLLLSPNGLVSSSARHAIVELLRKMRQLDECEAGGESGEQVQCGLFGQFERNLFQDEIIHQIIIGMGRLDAEEEDQQWPESCDGDVSGNEIWYDAGGNDERPGPEDLSALPDIMVTDEAANDSRNGNINPYFPVLPPVIAAPPQVPPIQALPPSVLSECVMLAQSPMSSLSFLVETDESPADPWSPPPTPPPMTTFYTSHSEGEIPAASQEDDEQDPSELAAVGRLSSMSLVAAVTAGGPLSDETKIEFVKEVERVGHDSIYWVRREASFALGALAKVVPEEIVVCSLLPVFESLRSDSVWHVRHSSLFALPALLARLSPALRRTVSLETIVPMSRDDSPAVRSGVLEALGEVIYAFHEDKGGPPEEVLNLFLGREVDRRANEAQQQHLQSSHPFMSIASTLDPFYDDPSRPLTCAFNIPAVALTLGRIRWGELRALYLTLAQNRSIKVRRTLAASLGDLAKVIGPENAQRDLMAVWWDAMRCEEDSDIRMKAIESVKTFVEALGDSEGRDTVIRGLLIIWDEGWLRKWREREGIVSVLIQLEGRARSPEPIIDLLKKGLEDGVGGVREAAITVVYQMSQALDVWKHVFDAVWASILVLAESSSHRRRMTFVGCQQALVHATQYGKSMLLVNDTRHWKAFSQLSDDNIIGVRIGVARLTGIICNKLSRDSKPVPQHIRDLVIHLLQDSCQEVRSFVSHLELQNRNRPYSSFPAQSDTYLTFSRPPPSATSVEGVMISHDSRTGGTTALTS